MDWQSTASESLKFIGVVRDGRELFFVLRGASWDQAAPPDHYLSASLTSARDGARVHAKSLTSGGLGNEHVSLVWFDLSDANFDGLWTFRLARGDDTLVTAAGELRDVAGATDL